MTSSIIGVQTQQRKQDSRRFPLRFFLYSFVIGVLLALYLITINFYAYHSDYPDYKSFYDSARSFYAGENIYLSGEDTQQTNLNPPFHTLLLLPFTLFGYASSFWAVSIFSITLGVIGAISIYRATTRTRTNIIDFLPYLTLLFFYYPTFISVINGQFSLALLFLLAVGWISSRARKDKIAGMALGFALSVKLFVGLFLIYFIVHRRWCLLVWLIVTWLLCGILALIVLGLDSYQEYYLTLKGVYWFEDEWNASFLGFYSRVFRGSELPLIDNLYRHARELALLSSVLLVFCLAWTSRPISNRFPTAHYDVGYSLTVVLLLLISPLGWMYYFPILLIPVIVVWKTADQFRFSAFYKTAIGVAWILSTIPSLNTQDEEVIRRALWYSWSGGYFYALLLLAGTLAVLAHRMRQDAGSDEKRDRGLTAPCV